MFGALAALGVGTAIKYGSDYLKGSTSNYFAEKRARDQAALEYEYAQRYAENSPSWNVKGLRVAGLNPILAASGGFSAPTWKPSSPSTPDTNSGVSADSFNQMLNDSQNRDTSKSQELLNNSSASLNTANVDHIKAQTATEMLKAEQIKQDLKGKGYKNPVVNDVNRALSDLGGAMNSPNNVDSRSAFIKDSPHDNFRDSLSFSDRQKLDAIESLHGSGSAIHVDRDLRDKYDEFKSNKDYHKYRKHRSFIVR